MIDLLTAQDSIDHEVWSDKFQATHEKQEYDLCGKYRAKPIYYNLLILDWNSLFRHIFPESITVIKKPLHKRNTNLSRELTTYYTTIITHQLL